MKLLISAMTTSFFSDEAASLHGGALHESEQFGGPVPDFGLPLAGSLQQARREHAAAE
jgi:hypothetical protein